MRWWPAAGPAPEIDSSKFSYEYPFSYPNHVGNRFWAAWVCITTGMTALHFPTSGLQCCRRGSRLTPIKSSVGVSIRVMGLDESLEGWLAIPSQLRTQRGDVFVYFSPQSHRGNHKNSAKFFCSSLWLCVAVVNLFLCAEFTLS